MRVALDARSLIAPVPRGWDRYLLELADALEAEGADVTMVHRAGAPPHAGHRVRCALLPVDARSGLHWEQVALPRALRAGRFDVYHAPAEHGVPLWAPCPVVLTIHSATGHSYRRLVDSGVLPGRVADYLGWEPDWRGWRALYWTAQTRRASHVLTPSRFCHEEVTELLSIPGERVTVTPLGLPREFAREAEPERPERPYLLFVGGYEPHKNPAGLLAAFELVRRRRPEFDLVMAGSGDPPSRLLETAPQGVRFLSRWPRLPELYAGASAFVSLSWRETFCLPAIEAMSQGVRPVLSQYGAASEVAGDHAILVDPRDIARSADAIVDALDRPPSAVERSAMKLHARRYTWEAAAGRTLDVYRKVAA